MMEFRDENGRRLRRPYELIDGIDESPTGSAVVVLSNGTRIYSSQIYEDVVEKYYKSRQDFFDWLKEQEDG